MHCIERTRLLLIGILVSVVVFGIGGASAEIPTGASANLVIGQPNFLSNAAGRNASTLAAPVSVAVDPTTGKVFVADNGNNRILRYGSASSLLNGAAADLVIGQANFTSGAINRGGAVNRNTINQPRGIFVDTAGNLWIADGGNNRVLMFRGASNLTGDPLADLVLGQTNFTTNSSITDPTFQMDFPEGVWIDAAGRLWVPGNNNHRVLRFDNAANLANGAPANAVLGQPDFNGTAPALSATGLDNPYGSSVDAAGTLWITDQANNRVLGYSNAAGLPNGAPADRVFGQAAFTTNGAGTSATTLSGPRSAQVDASGTLWVFDSSNNRVLGYRNVAAKINGASADIVVGQASFNSSVGGLGADRLSLGGTAFLFVEPNGDLWVTDRGNNRVLRFSPANPDTTPPVLKIKGRKKIKSSRAKIVLRGTASDAEGILRIEGKASSGAKIKKIRGTTAWRAIVTIPAEKPRAKVTLTAVDQAGNRSRPARVTIVRP